MNDQLPPSTPTAVTAVTAVTDGPTRRGVVRLGAAAAVGVAGLSALAACGSDDAGETDGAAEGSGAALAKLADIPVGGAILVTAGSGPVILSRTAQDTVVGFSAKCPHQGCSVAPGDAALTCPCHGSTFDTATGAVQQGPAESDLAAFAVTVDGEDVVPA